MNILLTAAEGAWPRKYCFPCYTVPSKFLFEASEGQAMSFSGPSPPWRAGRPGPRCAGAAPLHTREFQGKRRLQSDAAEGPGGVCVWGHVRPSPRPGDRPGRLPRPPSLRLPPSGPEEEAGDQQPRHRPGCRAEPSRAGERGGRGGGVGRGHRRAATSAPACPAPGLLLSRPTAPRRRRQLGDAEEEPPARPSGGGRAGHTDRAAAARGGEGRPAAQPAPAAPWPPR